jgi:hypothetical protein
LLSKFNFNSINRADFSTWSFDKKSDLGFVVLIVQFHEIIYIGSRSLQAAYMAAQPSATHEVMPSAKDG